MLTVVLLANGSMGDVLMDHLLIVAAAIGIVVVQVVTAWHTSEKLGPMAGVPAQLQIIHEQTNSQLAKLRDELKTATQALVEANLHIQRLMSEREKKSP